MPQVEIHLLTNENNKGDRSQGVGVRESLLQHYKSEGIAANFREWQEYDLESLTQFITRSENTLTHHIVIGMGDHGLKALQLVKAGLSPDSAPKVTFHWQSHQPVKGLVEASKKFDTVALPEWVITPELQQSIEKNTTLLKTDGVAHDLPLQKLSEKGQTLLKDLAAKRFYGVFLGGDAPTPEGAMRYFTVEEAAAYAKRIGEMVKKENAFLLVTNHPRTGKFDPATGKEVSPHRGEVDKVSAAFLKTLDAEHVPYRFYNFDFTRPPSAYHPILGLLAMQPAGGKAFVTAESTSMLTEVSDTLPRGALYMLPVSSMNQGHVDGMQHLYKAGRGHILATTPEKDQAMIVNNTVFGSVADVIAEAIHQSVKNRWQEIESAQKTRSAGGDMFDRLRAFLIPVFGWVHHVGKQISALFSDVKPLPAVANNDNKPLAKTEAPTPEPSAITWQEKFRPSSKAGKVITAETVTPDGVENLKPVLGHATTRLAIVRAAEERQTPSAPIL